MTCVKSNTQAMLRSLWQSATPTKRLWSKSKKRPNQSQSRAKNFYSPSDSNAHCARPKSGYPSHRASSPSSRAEAVAAGGEFEWWSLERVVEMTADFWRRKEDAKFEDAFAELEC